MPSPSHAMSKPSFARCIIDRWPWNSSHVSWIVRSGAPDSSN
jgi:3-methyladenine DNA glycosylase AlkC